MATVVMPARLPGGLWTCVRGSRNVRGAASPSFMPLCLAAFQKVTICFVFIL